MIKCKLTQDAQFVNVKYPKGTIVYMLSDSHKFNKQRKSQYSFNDLNYFKYKKHYFMLMESEYKVLEK